MSPIYTPGKVVLRKTWQPMDADAAAYITAVETADGQALEEKVKIAIDNFVLGCKADGIWSAIKASCILAGARTLAGALVPLVGTAPTNFNFVAGDYNRETGLVGDGSTKYLGSNRNNNADAQDNQHVSVYASNYTSTTQYLIGGGANNPGASNIGYNSGSFYRSRNNSSITGVGSNVPGFIGISRAGSSSFFGRNTSVTAAYLSTSQTPANAGISVFASDVQTGARSNSRLAFYSIGESLNLALLDARVTDLINAFGAAIP
jgi:hypothetical protein